MNKLKSLLDTSLLSNRHKQYLSKEKEKEIKRDTILKIEDDNVYVKGIGGFDGTNPSESYSLQDVSSIIKITWSELKALRDSSSLQPSQKYRITDYTCTTTQANTQSAGHQFDIIVTALSEDTLSEQASAILHEGDTYFANNNLSAWKLWYCLDNDTDRFAWADNGNLGGIVASMNVGDLYYQGTSIVVNNVMYYDFGFFGGLGSETYCLSATPSVGDKVYFYSGGNMADYGVTVTSVIPSREGGTGVIYHMIDEFNNDCPYDFKNIQFTKSGNT